MGGAFDFDDMHLEADQAGMTNSINSKFEHFKFGKYNKSLGNGIELQDFVENKYQYILISQYVL